MSFAPSAKTAGPAISNGGVAGTEDGTPGQTGTMMIAGLENMNTSTNTIPQV